MNENKKYIDSIFNLALKADPIVTEQSINLNNNNNNNNLEKTLSIKPNNTIQNDVNIMKSIKGIFDEMRSIIEKEEKTKEIIKKHLNTTQKEHLRKLLLWFVQLTSSQQINENEWKNLSFRIRAVIFIYFIYYSVIITIFFFFPIK